MNTGGSVSQDGRLKAPVIEPVPRSYATSVRAMMLQACERLSINPYCRDWPDLTTDEREEAIAFELCRRDLDPLSMG